VLPHVQDLLAHGDEKEQQPVGEQDGPMYRHIEQAKARGEVCAYNTASDGTSELVLGELALERFEFLGFKARE